MKKTIILIFIAILLPIIVACNQNLGPIGSAFQATESAAAPVQKESTADEQDTQAATTQSQTVSTEAFGSAGALADDSYTLEEMLVYAIQDEYAAKLEYDTVIDVLGEVNPFTNIVNSEASHISQLIPLFETNGINIPEEISNGAIKPGTLEEAKIIGAEAEINNIAMYERFLQEELPADVRAVFENLKAASEGHLTAFQNTGNGNGSGNGAGKGKES